MAKLKLYERAALVDRKDVDGDGNPVGKIHRVAVPGKLIGSIELDSGVSPRQFSQLMESGSVMIEDLPEAPAPAPKAKSEEKTEAPVEEAPKKKAKKKAAKKTK